MTRVKPGLELWWVATRVAREHLFSDPKCQIISYHNSTIPFL